MIPERIAEAIGNFIASCESPALLAPGEKPLALARDCFRVDITARGTWLEAWDGSRVWSRKILSAGVPIRKSLELEAFRFGKKKAAVRLVDVADARTAVAIEKTGRSAFREQFRLFLNRNFGNWRWETFRSEAKLEASLSPVFPTALLTRGTEAVAALAAPDRDTSFHALTFALVWLDWVQRHHGEIAASRLLLYLPEKYARPVVLLARNLHPRLRVEIWLYAANGDEYLLDPANSGNLETTLLPRYSRLGGPAWWVYLLGRYPEVDTTEESDGSLSYRIRGLEIGRLRSPSGNQLPLLEFGVPRRKKATERDAPEIVRQIEEVLTLRQAGASNQTNPIYRNEPERWLEAEVRRHLTEIDACLQPDWIYGQALGSLQGERSAVDLLGIDLEGRLAILELKASEDIHLPLQAFDYWLRVRHHLDHGDFPGSGYFPGLELSRNAPRVFLVSPSLHFHPMTDAVLQWLPTECSILRVGLNGQWRQRLDAVLRM